MEKFIIWLWISLFEFNQDYATNLIIRVKNTPEINAIVKFMWPIKVFSCSNNTDF